MMSGALTQSAAIGVAQDAIGTLPGLSSAQVKSEQNLVAVGYAVTYPLGTILCAMLLANVLPPALPPGPGEGERGAGRRTRHSGRGPGHRCGYYETVLRAHRIERRDLVGRSIADFETQQQALGRRVYITRVRRDGAILPPQTQSLVLREGDVVAISALRHDLVDFDVRSHVGGPEADDTALLVPDRDAARGGVREGRAGQDRGGTAPRAYMAGGVYIEKLYRAGAAFPFRLSTPVERGGTRWC